MDPCGARKMERESYMTEKQKALKKEILWWIKAIVIISVLTLIFTKKIVVLANIPSESMESTIKRKDRVLASRLAYNDEDPKRGDIAIFYAPDEIDTLFIKRVIGLPGEKVVINEGKIYIDGSDTPLEENYLKGEWTSNTGYYEFDIPDDCYLMLGDNRNRSKDARLWINKYVPRDSIIAKAEFVYFPFGHIKSLDEDVYEK